MSILMDYSPPPANTMNEARRKKLKRIEVELTRPRYDKFLLSDSERVLRSEEWRLHEAGDRKNVAERVSQVVQKGLGEGWKVVDVSPYTWGATFTAPEIELAVTRDQPLPSNEDPRLLPGYNINAIAELLQTEGLPVTTLTPVFTTSSPFPAVYSPSGRFTVHIPPAAPHVALTSLLGIYIKLHPFARPLIAILRAWVRSHFEEEQARQLSTPILALLVISYMQTRNLLPNLQSPEVLPRAPEPTAQLDGLDDIDVRHWNGQGWQCMVSAQYKHVFGGLFEFLWSLDRVRNMVTVRHGGIRRRDFGYATAKAEGSEGEEDESEEVAGEEKPIHEDPQVTKRKDWPVWAPGSERVRYLKGQPPHWMPDRIVVQHPFLPLVNLAHALSVNTIHNFQQLAQRTSILLQTTNPLPSVFGTQMFSSAPLTLAQLYTSPPALPNRHPDIEADMLAYYEQNWPKQKTLRDRDMVMADILRIVQTQAGVRFELERFGSTAYVDAEGADLDLVITDTKSRQGPEQGRTEGGKHKIYNMNALASFLQGKFHDIRPIPWATVPIVKAVHSATGIHVDINTNDRLGLRNTDLLKLYCHVLPMLRPLVFFIKRWAKSHGMNDPSGANGPVGFSSYCLTLMTISYLQMRGMLPNVQSVQKEPFKHYSKQAVWMKLANGTTILCDTRFGEPPENWMPTELTMEEALHGWFRYWGEAHAYRDVVASIKHGGIVPRDVRMPSKTSGGKALAGAADTTEEGDEAGRIIQPRRSVQEGEDGDGDAEFDMADNGLSVHEEQLAHDLKDVESSSGDEELNATTAPQPRSWQTQMLVVQDPFIAVKNCAGNVPKKVLEQFRLQCLRAYAEMNEGLSLQELFGQGRNLPGKARGRGRWPYMINSRGRSDRQGASRGAAEGQEQPAVAGALEARPLPDSDGRLLWMGRDEPETQPGASSLTIADAMAKPAWMKVKQPKSGANGEGEPETERGESNVRHGEETGETRHWREQVRGLQPRGGATMGARGFATSAADRGGLPEGHWRGRGLDGPSRGGSGRGRGQANGGQSGTGTRGISTEATRARRRRHRTPRGRGRGVTGAEDAPATDAAQTENAAPSAGQD